MIKSKLRLLKYKIIWLIIMEQTIKELKLYDADDFLKTLELLEENDREITLENILDTIEDIAPESLQFTPSML
jgi:hypothetical protein